MTGEPRDDAPEFDGFPPALHAKVAAAKAAWKVAVCARHAVVPEHYWPHEADLAALRAGRALTELASRYVERAVVAARAEGLGWPAIGEALGLADPEAVFGPAIAEWTEELARVRAGQVDPEAQPALDWVVDTAWWAEALREWLSSPGRNPLDSAAKEPPANGNGWWRADTRTSSEDDEADAGLLT
ncbi:MAG TPA: hypothetical protein VJT49_23590 [Amycolatopsis sp.]|uniref:hypothetical protein n=1 Tax=Amycolatopsis sp. TaxID=37632 RepID=UPI002B493003|nr:hypothetical protein [Amycolatopsis sp.]HKS48038.1 hypothetical protein [Amycolatopsis sp.]